MKYFKFSMIFMTILLSFEINMLFAQDFALPQLSGEPKISISEVQVLVDNIREELIEEQICDIARTQFNSAIESPENLVVKILIRQRSYYKNIDNRNSIYVHYTVCDKNGAKIFEDCICTEGSGSIVSATMQTKQVGKAARGIKKFLKTRAVEVAGEESLIAKK